MIYFCCDLRRREAVRQSDLNGIDFVEVIDREAALETDRQRFLHLYLVNDPGAFVYTVDNIRIEGPNAIEIVNVTMGLDGQTNVLVIEVAEPGDFSPYTINIVTSALNPLPPPEIDPALASVGFSFKVECPSPFDCQSSCDCPEPETLDTEIDYTARDFYSFRRMMLDRLSVTAPAAATGHPADLSTALVEVLAYTADQLAYQQDAATTEAYLNKARSRISLKRMTRLVDYSVDEGCNARCFCHFAVSADVHPIAPTTLVIPRGSAVCTQLSEQPRTFARDDALLAQSGAVYETCHDVPALFSLHNEITFYTWSDARCYLPKGAVSATLDGHFPDLEAGMYLAFEEVMGARSGSQADRQLSQRQVVLLTQVQAFDADGEPLLDPVTELPITEIVWHGADALRFPMCISSETSMEEGRRFLEPVTVARGNMVLVDHGQTISGERLPEVPLPTLSWAPGQGMQVDSAKGASCTEANCEQEQAEAITPRYQPTLANRPLTFSPGYTQGAPATELLKTPSPSETFASVSLDADDGVEVRPYHVVRDMLAADDSSLVFTTEIERDGVVSLRFGDNVYGRRPLPETQFAATYRVGIGSAGHIGADKLYHLALPISEVTEVRNITPGEGGRDPETNAQIRKRAPFLFKTQERAVTRDDYQTLGRRVAGIQDVSCAYIHTGSWMTTFALPDPEDRVEVSDTLRTTLRDHYEKFRLTAHDVEVSSPVYVPLEVTLHVCVAPNASKSHVRQRLLKLFSSNRLPDGALGLLHPNRFRAGETLHLSPWLAAAQNVEGVIAAKVTRFRRFGDPRTSGLVDRKLEFGRTEIARIDNDISHPGNGVFLLDMDGGR
ncbi:baseplate J/gp47 family protein [Grimontia sp. NTOU-MAR1]|uniref:baseplate J/gp47 family protein n=1 Tax=Grimontia sp. NTOU-MAR1 TaxID=3111011 RepID=UPI002DBC508D|nr:baseplate J/gp47 family protein [Grimontia sp. NTOU-MAR1]WRV99809.1 baseplate J/gp47 family protein [Grimontia sp. NTOU-MAR1]